MRACVCVFVRVRVCIVYKYAPTDHMPVSVLSYSEKSVQWGISIFEENFK